MKNEKKKFIHFFLQHFLIIFHKKFIVHLGKEKDRENSENILRLFQIHGRISWDLRAIQVEAQSFSLHPNSTFVALGKSSTVKKKFFEFFYFFLNLQFFFFNNKKFSSFL